MVVKKMTNTITNGSKNNISYSFRKRRCFELVYMCSNGSMIKEIRIPIFKVKDFINNPDKYW